jgi:hypothetical protein
MFANLGDFSPKKANSGKSTGKCMKRQNIIFLNLTENENLKSTRG